MSHTEPHRRLGVGVLGAGTVGTEVIRSLREHVQELSERAGARLEITGIAVRSLETERDPAVPPELLTTDAAAVVDGADIVIELMGGLEPAGALLRRAVERGAVVVTANKALLASSGPELYEAAERSDSAVFFEAAVAGAVPVVRGIRESLAGDRVRRVLGIVNGTTNFILDEMTTHGTGFAAALASAQQLGYAEADPTADVEGHDAAAKAAILASLAFHSRVSITDVTLEGITKISPEDIAAATGTGHVVKLLAIIERHDGTDASPAGIAVRVHPALVPGDHPLASVRGAFNAVFVEAESAGTLMFYGQGAGGSPTASAVLGDVVAAARLAVGGGSAPAESTYAALPVLDVDRLIARMQIRLEVTDRPGVLAEIATAIAQHGVSIESLRQVSTDREPDGASIVLVTHGATEAGLRAAVQALTECDGVREVTSVVRVEGH